MLGLLDNRLIYWLPRLHFGVLLLVAGELIAWQNAASYSLLDWLVLLVIYVAAAAALLDLIVRFRVMDWRTLLLIAGLFGLLHGSLISLAAVDLDNFVPGLIFRSLGVGVLVFLLAFWMFRMMSSGRPAGVREILLAGAVGLLWGIWMHWFPALDGVTVEAVALENSIAYVVIALLVALLLPFVFQGQPEQMVEDDWLLTPYEWTAAGGVLLITAVLRSTYLNPPGLGIVLLLILMLVFMLVFTSSTRQGNFLVSATPPQLFPIIGWVVLLLPFGALALAGYSFPGESGRLPLYARVIFSAIAIFGAVWVPLVSVWMGIRLMMQYTREGL